MMAIDIKNSKISDWRNATDSEKNFSKVSQFHFFFVIAVNVVLAIWCAGGILGL